MDPSNITFNSYSNQTCIDQSILSKKNVYSHLIQALKQKDTALIDRCTLFYALYLDFYSLIDVLEAAIEFNHTELKWHCLLFITQNYESPEINRISDKENLSHEAKILLLCGVLFPDEFEIEIKTQRTLKIESNKCLSTDGIKFLTYLNKIIPIENLFIDGYFFNNETLEILAKIIPNISGLRIHDSRITKIPVNWLTSVKDLNCSNCPYIDIICAFAAENLKCDSCTNVKWIHAPKAKWLSSEKCTNVIDIDATAIEDWVNTADCFMLKDLHVQHAQMVNCPNNTHLVELVADKAIKVNCNNNKSLKNLNLSNVEILSANECDDLETIKAERAKFISIIDCPNVKITEVPKNCIIDTFKQKINNDDNDNDLDSSDKM